MYKDEDKKPPEVKESHVSYKRIVFSNFEEQEAGNYSHWLKLSPEERLGTVTTLIKQVFSDQLLSTSENNRITFDQL